MDNAQPKYRKLPGTGSALLAYSRLYLSDDHLLQVTFNGFTENYNRFLFSDIQGLTTRKSLIGLMATILLCIPILISFVIAISAPGGAPGAFIVAAIFGLPLAYHLYLGSTLVTSIHTRAGSYRLNSLRRTRTLNRVLQRLAPIIQAAQGSPAPQPNPEAPTSPLPDTGQPTP